LCFCCHFNLEAKVDVLEDETDRIWSYFKAWNISSLMNIIIIKHTIKIIQCLLLSFKTTSTWTLMPFPRLPQTETIIRIYSFSWNLLKAKTLAVVAVILRITKWKALFAETSQKKGIVPMVSSANSPMASRN